MKNINLYFLSLLILFFLFSGCANNKNIAKTNLDPFEKLNRNIFKFNIHLDNEIVSPINQAYIKSVPKITRRHVSNHLEWMDLPNTIINSTVQLEIENTILASAKFMLNGLTLGFYDLDNGETEIRKKDFGSTLAKLNFPEGPFLMLPFLGPKFSRDFSGTIIDRQNIGNISSTNLDDVRLVEIPINMIDKRGKFSKAIDGIYKSPDPYVKMRSYYTQTRRKNVYTETYKDKKEKEKDIEFEKLLQ